MQKAFTIVELVVVIVVIGILLTLGVVGLSTSQVQARDSQRQGAMETLAANLEKFYTGGVQGSTALLNRYPATVTLVGSGTNSTPTDELAILPDLGSLDTNGKLPILVDPSDATGGSSLRSATNTSLTTPTPTPSASNFIYVYQPFQASGSLCTTTAQECVRFNLYYYKESTNTIERITSRRQ